jgi:hypothetical protein
MPNTLFDSRHRTFVGGYFMSGILEDKLNYQCLKLLKDLHNCGYKLVFTHYALARLHDKVESLLKRHKFLAENGKLFTNFATQEVSDNTSLKRHICNNVIEPSYIIDNDPDMLPFYLNYGISPIQMPLSII